MFIFTSSKAAFVVQKSQTDLPETVHLQTLKYLLLNLNQTFEDAASSLSLSQF